MSKNPIELKLDKPTTTGPMPPDPELKRQAEEARGWAWSESSQEYKPLTLAEAERLPAPSRWKDKEIER